MEMLKKQMLTATGVPDVLMNYINEADFAKTIELANTRFQGRVVNYQLDFNRSLTELYRRLLKGSSNIDQNMINALEYTLSPPKASTTQITNEMLNNFNTYNEWLVSMYFGKDYQDDETKSKAVEEFSKRVAKVQLQMVDFSNIDKIFDESMVAAKDIMLNPANKSEEDEGAE
jgi:hypothetical protein